MFLLNVGDLLSPSAFPSDLIRQCVFPPKPVVATAQNAAKALSRTKPSLADKELQFDGAPLATQLFLGNISRQGFRASKHGLLNLTSIFVYGRGILMSIIV